ncbi:DUF726-domain-containing protein [Neocallimastix lanati (nom. inval.)]|jgi:hypothetical protein|nr:DUF726-domain-containing protein [Neocallimastix sp. JGI-2020a]
MENKEEIINLNENSSNIFNESKQEIAQEKGQEDTQHHDSSEEYVEALDEIKKNPIPFIGLIWKIIEKNNVYLNTLLLKDMEAYEIEQKEILEKKSKNDYDFSNFQIPAITNYSNWSRLLMDFLFKTYNINVKEQAKIMQGDDGYSDQELQDLILKSRTKNHKRNANNILCAGLTEILLYYFQNMEYTKTTTFELKNKKTQSNLFVYDARLRQVLRQFLKDILSEYQLISQKRFELELAQKLEEKSKEDEKEGKSEEIRREEEMQIIQQASDDYIYDVQENIDAEFSSIMPEVENRVSCLLWEEYQKALDEQKKKKKENEGEGSTYIKNEKSSAKNKWMMWGLATVGSGIIIGVTGGLAAPIVGAGLGTLGAGLGTLGTLLGITTTGVMAGVGTFLTTTSGVAIFGALFGLTGGGLTAYNFHKVFSGLKEFQFIELPYRGTDQEINKFLEKKKKEEDKKKSKENIGTGSDNRNGETSEVNEHHKNSISLSRSSTRSFSQSSVYSNNSNIDINHLSDSESTCVNTPENLSIAEDPHSSPSKLHVIICISGWLKDIEDIYKPWENLIGHRNTMSSNIYVLKFDSKILINLGQAMESMIVSGSITFTVKQLLRQTILGGVVSGLIWPVAMVQMGTMIDNPWTSGLDKAEKAGKVLAREVLLKYVHGKRPVTLVGYSLGARVIYYCLLELWNYSFEINMKKQDDSIFSWYRSKRNRESEANKNEGNEEENMNDEDLEKAKFLCHSIVDSIYLFGAPVESNSIEWSKLRAMTAGRVINGYCQTDWVLSFLFRASNICNHIAGLQKVNVEGVENIDLTSIVSGHLEYKDKLDQILEYVGFEDGIIVTH